MGGFPKLGVPFWVPNNEDYSILGSILGSPCFGKLPYNPQNSDSGGRYESIVRVLS